LFPTIGKFCVAPTQTGMCGVPLLPGISRTRSLGKVRVTVPLIGPEDESCG
jgi:hypothetical protein